MVTTGMISNFVYTMSSGCCEVGNVTHVWLYKNYGTYDGWWGFGSLRRLPLLTLLFLRARVGDVVGVVGRSYLG